MQKGGNSKAAAVVGVQFWPGAVAAALGRPMDAIERSLRRLEQRDLIHEQPRSTMAGQLEYRFGHVLVRDVCYQRLPRTERIARHQRTADWLESMAADRATDLAEVVAHHRYTAYEIARTLGLDASRHAPAARESLHRAARRAYALHALESAAAYAGRALTLFDARSDDKVATGERLRLELLATEIAFYADGNAFLNGGGEEQLAALAERLYEAGELPDTARAWTLLGHATWLRTDRTAALSYLNRAVELFDALPDTAEKADAYAELGRLHQLNFEFEPALAAAGEAAGIAERLGAAEVAANARITVATARYRSGDRGGLAELAAIAEQCRADRLLALPRARNNLAAAVLEEGDWAAAEKTILGDEGTGGNLLPGHSQEAARAYWTGDWDRLLAAAEALRANPSGEWDMQTRGVCAVIRLLRDDPEACADSREVDEILARGRRSGFHRVEWGALAHVALCQALLGRHDDATALLTELAASWRAVRAVAVGEWSGAAGFAAALSGHAASAAIKEILAGMPHRTPWVEAAARTVAGGLAYADGDAERAASMHAAAAAQYAEIQSVSDRMMALALEVRARQRTGDDPAMKAVRDELIQFAARVRAPRLLAIAGIES